MRDRYIVVCESLGWKLSTRIREQQTVLQKTLPRSGQCITFVCGANDFANSVKDAAIQYDVNKEAWCDIQNELSANEYEVPDIVGIVAAEQEKKNSILTLAKALTEADTAARYQKGPDLFIRQISELV